MAYNQKYMTAILEVLLYTGFLLVTSASAFSCGNSTECQALLKFKEGVKSDPYGNLQNWNKANNLCNWTGITCHQHLYDHVMALELIDMNLKGSISPFLSNLSLLTTLSLPGNNFHGEIPTSLGEFSKLRYLNMSDNKLESSIPASLQSCRSLEIMDLDGNRLSGVIPEEIGLIKSLKCLNLSSNRLTGAIPSSLFNLTEITELQLSDNYLTGKIPSELEALKKLEIMYFHVNYLEGSIPSSTSNCTALKVISLGENHLTGEIPSEIGNKLQNLQKIYMLINMLSGKIPVSLSNLSQLTLLDLSINNIEGEVPVELGKLKKLEILSLHSNYLVSGSDNSSLSFLTALTNCSVLKKLHLASCYFKGSLPASVGHLSKQLYYFNLLNNKIKGEIPDSIGNLSSLVTFTLWYNYLEGQIPATFGKLGQLQRLSLGKNRLTGSIPSDIGKMASLGLLDLSENLISGPIPASFGKLSQLRYLNLSQNHLSGNFPIELTHCSLLMMLDLSFNKLQGSLPSEIGLFSNLALSFNLSNNNLDGELPASIGKLESVEAIDLSVNKFSGVLPCSIGNCKALEYLNLSSNMIGGTIPVSFKQIAYLQVLDLAYNQLTGNVPLWLANNKMIKRLNLSYNKLTGQVPFSGRFKKLNRSSFVGNEGLCGGPSNMRLPACDTHKQKHRKSKLVYYVVPAAACGALFLTVLVLLIIRRFLLKTRTYKLVDANLIVLPRNFTEREIETATFGFNEVNLVGRGSIGAVYKGIIDDGTTFVAIKVLNTDCNRSYKSFQREFQILSGIKHRNLVKMIGSAWTSRFKALVLEFVGNGNLEQHLYPEGSSAGACGLTLKQRMSIAIDVGQGLEYLHEGLTDHVIHCDMKPGNVLLDNDMVAHVADFGIGKLIFNTKPNGYLSSTGFLRGTIGYIPPEYGQGMVVSAKGDVYSYGVMLLEMITRKSPTDEMFMNGLDIRKWVSSAFPNRILDVVDMSMQQEAEPGIATGALHRLEACCIQVLDIGLMCTKDSPQARPTMPLVVQRLKQVREEMRF